MHEKPHLPSSLDIKVLLATCVHICLPRAAYDRMVLSKRKRGEKDHGGSIGYVWDAKQRLIFFTVVAPEKTNFDIELPLYKQTTILSNNLICMKPTENSLKNQ